MATLNTFRLPPKALEQLLRLRESNPAPQPPGSVQLQERFFSADERRKLAASGHALPDGSFPIENADDLAAAIHLVGKGGPSAKAHIIKRARALGLVAKLPADWKISESATSKLPDDGSSPAGLPDSAGQDVTIAEHVELIEARVIPFPDGSGLESKHVVEVTLIRSGESKMGNVYPADVLARSAPIFEGATAYADHNRRSDLPERSIRDIVGRYQNVRAISTADGSTHLRSELHLLPGTDWLFTLLSEAEKHPALCGLSIDAYGKLDEAATAFSGKTTVAGFNRVNSVDVVTRPSAGGGVLRVLQSEEPPAKSPTIPLQESPAMYRCPHCNKQLQDNEDCKCDVAVAERTKATAVATLESKPSTAASEGTAGPPNGHPNGNGGPGSSNGHAQLTESNGNGNAQPADLAHLMEQVLADRQRANSELSRLQAILNPNPDPAAASNNARDDIVRLAEELRRERDLTRCESALITQLNESTLPPVIENKLKKRFAGKIFDPNDLKEAIQEEADTLAALDATGQIRGMGYEKPITMGMNEYQKVQAAFDKLFDIEESEEAKAVPAFSGLREAFYVATGRDIGSVGGANLPIREALSHSLQGYVRRGMLKESEVLLREADVTTASFSYLLGTSMNKRLLKDYQAWPSEWQKFSTITAIKDFKQQDRVRLGAFGSLSTVAEDAAYTTLTVTDTRATYTPAKRGNLVQVTRETIINDDLYAIKQIPQKLAVAAAFTLAEFVYNLMAPSFGNIYDAHNLFDSINHLNTAVIAANLGTQNSGTALSSAALQTAVIKMRKQTNMASKPIGLKPRYVLVCPDLEFSAMTILRSAGLPGGNNNDINPMMGYAEPIVSPQLNALTAGPASTTICIAVADPRVIDTLEVGFIGGQANPVLLIQDMPLYGLNFTQDTISYKVRHEYGGAIVDYRGFYLINN
jgi:Mu-like prophage major head subunit gpT